MYYASVELVDHLLPIECHLVKQLQDPEKPQVGIALIELAQETSFLPKRIIIAPKGGFDVSLRNKDDIIYVYAFVANIAEDTNTCSLRELWNQGVKDWGSITETLTKARDLQARAD